MTGQTRTVRKFVEGSFAAVQMDLRSHVEIGPRYFRPIEVNLFRADPNKAMQELDRHTRAGFEALIQMMVDADFEAVELEPVRMGLQMLGGKFNEWHSWKAGVMACLPNARKGIDRVSCPGAPGAHTR